MNKTQEALKMAIEALDFFQTHSEFWKDTADEAIQACKEALEQPNSEFDVVHHNVKQPAQEPVAWRSEGGMLTEAKLQAQSWISHGGKAIPLYTNPAPAWQGLSDDEKKKIWFNLEHEIGENIVFGGKLADAIEQALKEKNSV